jgi:deazaflavin-dependent oxidoreductase (nitroreductase family)
VDYSTEAGIILQSKQEPVRGYQKLMKRLFRVRPAVWFLSNTAHLIDSFLMSVTNGRHSAAALLMGLPVISLTTTGAKSGRPRTVPLLGIPDGENMILIASNWGQGHHPGWYYNIRTNPRVEVTIQGQTTTYIAHKTEGEERQECWQRAAGIYPGYEAYKKWTRGREIPVIRLVPEN